MDEIHSAPLFTYHLSMVIIGSYYEHYGHVFLGDHEVFTCKLLGTDDPEVDRSTFYADIEERFASSLGRALGSSRGYP